MSEHDQPIETPLALRKKELMSLRASLTNFRKHASSLSEADLRSLITGQDVAPRWIAELVFLMGKAQRCTLNDLCELVSVNRATLMAWRRKTPKLERVCTDFLAGTFEAEMEQPERQIRPQILALAADRIIPTFMKNGGGGLSEEDVGLLVRSILDSLRNRIGLTGLSEEAQAALLRGVGDDIRHEFEKRSAD